MKAIEIIKNSVKETVFKKPKIFAVGTSIPLIETASVLSNVSQGRIIHFLLYEAVLYIVVDVGYAVLCKNDINKNFQYYAQSLVRGCLFGTALTFGIQFAVNHGVRMQLPNWLQFGSAGNEMTIKFPTQLKLAEQPQPNRIPTPAKAGVQTDSPLAQAINFFSDRAAIKPYRQESLKVPLGPGFRRGGSFFLEYTRT